MQTKQAYNIWAEQYDTSKNRTRDLEAKALRSSLANTSFDHCLEIGCGTGKNTAWLITRANHVTAVDFSEEMLAKARTKIQSNKVQFYQADITESWQFKANLFDLLVFSLVLEHIENLEDIFQKAAKVMRPNGVLYIGELHPFKQYSGSKARFETEKGTQFLTCFTHHISDYIQAAKRNGFEIVNVNEYFDDANRGITPRILSLLFRRA